MRCRDDRGQVTPLLVLVLLAALGAVVLLGHVGRVVLDRAEAQAAADAAALAGAVEGRRAAEELARRNGGSLVAFHRDGADAVAVVEVGAARATARARRDAPPLVDPGACRRSHGVPYTFPLCPPSPDG